MQCRNVLPRWIFNALSWLLVFGCINVYLISNRYILSGMKTIQPLFSTLRRPQVQEVLVEEPLLVGKHIFDRVNLTQGRWDQSRQFKIFDHVYNGKAFEQLSRDYNVTLVTQSSLHKLHWLTQVSEKWSGPISISIFVSDIEYELTELFLDHIIGCDQDLGAKLAVHIFYDKNRPPKPINHDSIRATPAKSCSINTAVFLESLFARPEMKSDKFQKWRTTYPYPQNLARNVARKGANTGYTFVTDVDIVPSQGSAKSLRTFLATTTCQMCAFVIATYELHSSAEFPTNKNQLLDYVKQDKARPFHKTVFSLNQHATNFSMYERPQNDSQLHESHDVSNYEFFYEPFYVALDKAPAYDERFIGYGFTRNTQVYEMWISGWIFKVISPVFAIHWGFQKKTSRPRWREMQNNRNSLRFKAFKNEVWARYGKTPPPPKKGKRSR